MADQFIGEIRIFAGGFAPVGWAFCNGQLMTIIQNTALFALIGNIYGGDGKTTFGLPNLQGAAPLHVGSGQGVGLSPHFIGRTGGAQSVTLAAAEMPAHSHTAQAASTGAQASPAGNSWASAGFGRPPQYAASGAANVQMSLVAVTPAGGNLPHNNMPPYFCLNFIIALTGIFPPRA